MTVRTILVGVDGSAGAEQAGRWATDLADRTGASLVAVYATAPFRVPVMTGAPSLMSSPGTAQGSHRDIGDAFVSTWCQPLRNHGCGFSTMLINESPSQALLAAASRTGADAIVVGNRGEGGFADLAPGSVGHHLIHHATVPVVVVPKAPRPQTFGRIVVGVGPSESGARAVGWAAGLAGDAGAEIVLAGALDRDPHHVMLTPDERRTLLGALEGRLNDLAAPLRAQGLRSRVIVREGNAAATFLEIARELEVALLVVGRPGLDWLTENADGSASHELSHHSSVPLAVIPGIH